MSSVHLHAGKASLKVKCVISVIFRHDNSIGSSNGVTKGHHSTNGAALGVGLSNEGQGNVIFAFLFGAISGVEFGHFTINKANGDKSIQNTTYAVFHQGLILIFSTFR